MFQFVQRQRCGGQHLRGAVVERQALLEGQANRRKPCTLERFGTRDAFTFVERFAATQQHDGQVRKRRKVATGAHRALFRHHRHDVGIEHRGERLERLHANARMAAHQRIDADYQHGAHDVRCERLAHANRMGGNQVVLQFFQQRAFGLVRVAPRQLVAQAMRAQQLVGVAAKTSSNAIGGFAAADLVGQEISRTLHAQQLLVVQFHSQALAGHRHQLFAGEAVAVQENGLCSHAWLQPGRAFV